MKNYLFIYLFLNSLLIAYVRSLDIQFDDEVVLIPQSSSYQGQQIEGIKINVPLLSPSISDPAPRLSLFKTGFLCPSSSCVSSSSCSCDFTASCSELPSCCLDDPLYPLVCDLAEPIPFVPILPNTHHSLPSIPPFSTLTTEPPLYLRYHPSPDAQCRGFSFDLRSHPILASTLDSSPMFDSVEVYVSLRSPTPETDPDAWHYSIRYTEIYAPTAPIWCPAPSLGSGFNVTLSSRQEFLSSSNDRTVFFALFSSTLNSQDDYMPIPMMFYFGETNIASDMLLVDAIDATIPSSILDQQSLLMYGESGQYDFLYHHQNDQCQNITINTRTLNSGDTDLYIDFYPDQLHPWYTNSRWNSFRFDGDTIVLQLCPDESIMIDVTMYTGDFFFLSLSSSAPLLTLDIHQDIHPLMLTYEIGWRMTSRLICQSSVKPSSFSGNPGEVVFPCTSFTGAYPDNCVEYFPLYPGEASSLLWPTPPTPTYFDLATLRHFNISQLAGFPSLALSPQLGVYSAAVVLQASSLDSAAIMTYFSPEQFDTCQLEFLGTMADQWGRRLFGLTKQFQFLNGTQLKCDNATAVEETTGQLSVLNEVISSTEFSLQPSSHQLSTLFAFVRYQLQAQYSVCNYLVNNNFLHSEIIDLISQSVISTSNGSLLLNCSGYDPCCPSPFPTTLLYDVCQDLSSSYFLITETEDDYLDAHCPDAVCLPEFLSEISQFKTHPAVPGQVDDLCSSSLLAIQLLIDQSLFYYHSCKDKYLGSLDEGILCNSDDDCTSVSSAFQCLPTAQGGLLSSELPFSTSQRLRRKTCQAPTSIFDALILDCLIQTMPAYLTKFLSKLSIDSPAQFQQAISVPGCRLLDPTPLLVGSPRWYQFGTPDISCPYRSSCPYPLNLFDDISSLPYLCTGAFASCTHSLSGPHRSFLGDADTCLAYQFRCNRRLSTQTAAAADGVQSPAVSRFHTCLDSASTVECETECAALYGSFFCGHCPSQNQTDCFQVVEATDQDSIVPLDVNTCSVTPTCYHSDLGLLVAGPCGESGSCNLADPAFSGTTLDMITTQQECLAQTGICVDDVQRTILSGNGCYGGFTSRYSYNGRTVPHGRSLDPIDYPNLGSPESCEAFPDNAFPTRYLRWVPSILTQNDCLDNEDIFVCYLPNEYRPGYASTPVLYNRSLCQEFGGLFRSPYIWVNPIFTPGVDVFPDWIPTTAHPATEWSERIDYGYFASLLTSALDQWQISAQVDQTLCSAAGSFKLAINAIPCECGDSDDMTCPVFLTSSAGIPPAQLLGRATFCNSAQIPDDLTYPNAIDLSTVSLSTLNDDSSLRHIPSSEIACLQLSVFSYSTSLFSFSRSRSRQTSFFLARQDETIAPLSTLSSRYTPNGLILSDGFQFVSHLSEAAGRRLQVCLQPRFDFIAYLNATFGPDPSAYPFSHLRFALFEDWRVVPLSHSHQPLISVTYLPQEGSLITVNNSRLAFPITHIYRICGIFEKISFDSSSSPILVATLSRTDPEDIDNGFTTAETVWLYITAGCFTTAVLFHLLLACYLFLNDSLFTGNQLVCAFLILFMIFRAALLFSLADGTLVANSTTEFGLTDAGTLCEFLAILLEFYLLQKLLCLANSTPLSPLPHIFLAAFLICIFFGFVLAYGLVGDTSGGISRPSTTCFGRIPVDQTDWDTHRIIRFVDQLVLAVVALGLGISQIKVSFDLYRYHKRCDLVMDHKLLRLSIATGIFAFALLTHAIISVILIATQYNNFIFGMTLTWVTELLPSIIYLILAEISTTRQLVKSFSSKLSTSSRSKSRSNHPSI